MLWTAREPDHDLARHGADDRADGQWSSHHTETREQTMSTSAYAIAYLRNVDFGEAIIDYLSVIDTTLAPFGGRFLVHGGEVEGIEGEWDGSVIIIEFPDHESARGWYDSPAYQAILPLRTDNSDGIAAIVDGVHPGYRATDGLAAMLAPST
jgi:uncharacterized protein (DUF1330 family)